MSAVLWCIAGWEAFAALCVVALVWAVTKAATPVLAWLERLQPLDLLPDTELDDERAYRLAQVEDAANEVWADLTCFIGHMQGWESEWVEYRETELMGGQS